MMKHEFEALTMRGNAEIGGLMYESIEHFYMSDNAYHQTHGGRDETKQDFCKRVFGGKVNTPKTILAKTIAELQRENRYCLQGNATATKAELDRHDKLIAEHETAISEW